jgi:hypothetical protein
VATYSFVLVTSFATTATNMTDISPYTTDPLSFLTLPEARAYILVLQNRIAVANLKTDYIQMEEFDNQLLFEIFQWLTPGAIFNLAATSKTMCSALLGRVWFLFPGDTVAPGLTLDPYPNICLSYYCSLWSRFSRNVPWGSAPLTTTRITTKAYGTFAPKMISFGKMRANHERVPAFTTFGNVGPTEVRKPYKLIARKWSGQQTIRVQATKGGKYVATIKGLTRGLDSLDRPNKDYTLVGRSPYRGPYMTSRAACKKDPVGELTKLRALPSVIDAWYQKKSRVYAVSVPHAPGRTKGDWVIKGDRPPMRIYTME